MPPYEFISIEVTTHPSMSDEQIGDLCRQLADLELSFRVTLGEFSEDEDAHVTFWPLWKEFPGEGLEKDWAWQDLSNLKWRGVEGGIGILLGFRNHRDNS